MKIHKWMRSACAISAVVALVWSVEARGQQIQLSAGHRAGAAYDVARESVISGKIVQYSAVVDDSAAWCTHFFADFFRARSTCMPATRK